MAAIILPPLHFVGDTSPASGFEQVTPHASNELGVYTRALYIGTGGTVVIVNQNGVEVPFVNVPNGFLLPCRTSRVDNSSTASDIVALW